MLFAREADYLKLLHTCERLGIQLSVISRHSKIYFREVEQSPVQLLHMKRGPNEIPEIKTVWKPQKAFDWEKISVFIGRPARNLLKALNFERISISSSMSSISIPLSFHDATSVAFIRVDAVALVSIFFSGPLIIRIQYSSSIDTYIYILPLVHFAGSKTPPSAF